MKKKAPGGRWQKALPDAKRDANLSCRVPEGLHQRAFQFAIAERTRLQEVTIAALDEYLKKRGA